MNYYNFFSLFAHSFSPAASIFPHRVPLWFQPEGEEAEISETSG